MEGIRQSLQRGMGSVIAEICSISKQRQLFLLECEDILKDTPLQVKDHNLCFMIDNIYPCLLGLTGTCRSTDEHAAHHSKR